MPQKLILPINRTKLTASIDTTAYVELTKKLYGKLIRHYGADMVSEVANTRVWGSGNGIVAAKGYDNACGNILVVVYLDAVNHKTGKAQSVTLRYFHMYKILVSVGQKVDTNTLLGYYGCTGSYAGTGPHLHLECDLDIKNVLYTPTVTTSNYLKGTSQGAYGFDSPKNTVVSPVDYLHRKTSQPDNQTYITAKDKFIRDADKAVPSIS